MRWTADKVAMLRDLGPRGIGARAIANQLGCSGTAIEKKAQKMGVSIARASPPPNEPYDKLRARWNRLLPKMKESLRAEIALL
jgi:hypothetical protein